MQVPLNLTGVRAVRPLLLSPATYSHIEQTLLKLNLPSQPPVSQQQQQQPSATVDGILICAAHAWSCFRWLFTVTSPVTMVFVILLQVHKVNFLKR